MSSFNNLFGSFFFAVINAIVLLLCTQQILANTPYSLSHSYLLPISELPVYECKDIDTEFTIPNKSEKRGAFQFGIEVPSNINPHSHGIWEDTPNGKIWRIAIKSPEAKSLNFIFEDFALPDSGHLYIYTPCLNHVLGPVQATQTNNSNFSSIPLPGNTVIIEYFKPDYIQENTVFTIKKIIHGHIDLFNEKAFGDSDYCHINVACPEADPWEKQIRSVVKIIMGGSYCTGTLINNTAQDGTPYLLTANHCFSNQDNLAFWFNWQSKSCSNPLSEPSYQFLSGASSIARSTVSDFWLLELNEAPPKEFKPYYAGWNRTEETFYQSGTASIHHPEGDIKKISWTEEELNTTAYGGATGTTHWKVPSWSGGTSTEGGSSGAALFDHNGRILGQLEGGFAACGNTASDFFGRFNVSWKGEETPASSLKDWLDPASSGEVHINGFDPYEQQQEENPVIFSESFNQLAFPPAGWSILSEGNNTWQKSSGYSITGDPPININPLQGNYFAYVAWTGLEQQNEWLISPSFNFENKQNLSLSFYFNGIYYWSVEPYNNVDLLVKYQIQNQDWQELWNDNEYEPWDSYQWNRVKLYNLEEIEGHQEVRFAFVYKGMDGANFNIDSITIRKNDIEIIPDFVAYPLEATVGDTILFEDLSTGSPIQRWQWNFGSGAVPATASGQGPHKVIYSTIGNKNVSLTLNNEFSHTKQQYITIESDEPCAPIYAFPFEENFNGSSALPDCWTKKSTSEVTWGGTSGFNINDLQIRAFKGSHFFDCGWTDEEFQNEWLFLPPFDLSAVENPAVSFFFNGNYHWSVNPFNNCDLDLLVSTDGSDWKRIWNEADSEEFTTNSYSWLHAKISLENFSLDKTVHLAFRYAGTKGANFGIDNVMVGSKNTLGVSNRPNLKFWVYPNPFQNKIKIRAEEPLQEISLYNILGKNIKQIDHPLPGENIMETDSLPKGIYLLRIKNNLQVQTSRIIIKQ